jgi:Flp pilus assembly protein TadD
MLLKAPPVFFRLPIVGNNTIRICCFFILLISLASCTGTNLDTTKNIEDYVSKSLAGSYLAGRQARRNNDLKKASNSFALAQSYEPNDPRLIREAFLVELNLGNIERASRLAARSLDLNNSAPFMMLVIGLQKAKTGEWERAAATFKKLSKSQLNQIIKPLALGWSAVAQNKPTLAVEFFSTVSKRKDFEMLGLLHLGLGYQIMKATKKADKAFKAALARSATPPDRLNISFATHYAMTGRPSLAKNLIESLRSGYLDKNLFIKQLNKNPNETLTDISIKNAADGLAEALFDIAQALKNDSVSEPALIFSQLALYMRPNFAAAQLLLGELLDRRREYSYAVKQFTAIKPKSAYFLSAQLQLATSWGNDNKPRKAISLLEKLSNNKPNDYRPFVQIGDLHRSLKKWDKAILAYSKALSLIPKIQNSDWIIYYSRGIAYEQSKDWQSAELDFLQALNLSPNQPFVMNYLGYAWAEQGINLTKANSLIVKAVKQRPRDGYIADSFGWVLYQTGEYKKAIPVLERAVRLRPNDATINDHLGDAYWKVGRLLEARFQWIRSTKMKLKNDHLEAINKKIKHGLR